MKNRFNIVIPAVAALLLSVSCGLDNYDAPDGGIYGRIVDQQTGEAIPLPVEGTTGAVINLMEVGTDATQPTGFYARQDGTYANSKVFGGKYTVTATGPFEVVGSYSTEINGQTELDITAVPFSRIAATASLDGRVIRVEYTVSVTDPDATPAQVNGYWDYRMQIDDQTGHYASRKTISDGKLSGTFTIDLESESQYNQNRHKIVSNGNRVWVRVGARVGGNINYSKVIEITLN
jgi:hypothetical protein